MKNNKIIPGELYFAHDDITINAHCESKIIMMENTGDRPIQVGSHFHLYEVNSAIEFYTEEGNLDEDRKIAWGRRFDIPSGTSIRFEPKEKKKVNVIEIAGERKVYGINNLCNGELGSSPKKDYSKLTAKDSLK